ncbi:DUF2125 domain-containing protein [Roseicyclus sp. F158]|uniref:DUF2125 domain-containing protein n=1 Tax=Tropicimonas omnivorans TaxID=3075590 RepID=A0ABU3DBQ7_9RHOB|nr:DUF2125 domain-containing protein [Roseicyclus sp. F158]MDT0681145.1 DUF2125 domain-containing protein [Roseicyclus sp. F158]
MTLFRTAGASAAALAVSATASFSLTAEDAWDRYQEYVDSFGQEITTESEEYSGGTLTLTGMVANYAPDEDEFSAVAEIGTVTLTEEDDGSVSVSMPDSYDVTVSTVDDEDERTSIVVTVSQEDADITINEAGDDLRFDLASPEISVVVDDLEGEDVPDEFRLELVAEDITASALNGSGEKTTSTSTFTAAALRGTMSGDDEEKGEIESSFSMTGVSGTTAGTGDFARFADEEMASDALASGLSMNFDAAYDTSTFSVVTTGGESDDSDISGASGPGSIAFGLSGDGISYGIDYTDVDVDVAGEGVMGGSISVSLAEAGIDFLMPVLQSEEAQPFDFALRLGGLELDESLWSMFDPAGILPRDPANLVVDLSGMGMWMQDIFAEPAESEDMAENEDPGRVESLEVNELVVSALGAELLGSGTFTFDNSEEDAFAAMPIPEGTMNLAMTGGNALLDRLVELGVLPSDQAMMARMMSGMIAKPGDTPDSLISEITITEDGQVLANGSPLPF